MQMETEKLVRPDVENENEEKQENVSKKNQKWYKVAKVGKKTTSYTVKKLKTGKYAGFYVIPTVKIGKKSYKADATWYTYTYMSKYY